MLLEPAANTFLGHLNAPVFRVLLQAKRHLTCVAIDILYSLSELTRVTLFVPLDSANFEKYSVFGGQRITIRGEVSCLLHLIPLFINFVVRKGS